MLRGRLLVLLIRLQLHCRALLQLLNLLYSLVCLLPLFSSPSCYRDLQLLHCAYEFLQ